MQAYSNPAHEADPHKLPDLDLFYHQHFGPLTDISLECPSDDAGECDGTGWYWCYCFPGCIPDSQWFGPYEMYELALVAARESSND